jgi:flavin reductase (DIM6/NTAB) family NADH-FMN oxidoreductase RutF
MAELVKDAACISPQDFRALMRLHANGVAVVACGPVGARTGLTITAVCALSDAPPSLLVCVNARASAHDALVRQQRFSLNFLAAEQADLAKVFAGQAGLSGEARFAGGDWETLPSGAPALVSAVAVADCCVADRFSFGSHSVLAARITGAHARPGAAPLLYFHGAFARLLPAGLEAAA